MKSSKQITAILIAGFLAFAPPGTMIFLLALVVGFAGYRWALALCVVAGVALLLLYRGRRPAKPREDEPEPPETN